jgi:hypothetical protein
MEDQPTRNLDKLISLTASRTDYILADEVCTRKISLIGEKPISLIDGKIDLDSEYNTRTITLLQMAERLNAIIERLNKMTCDHSK